jgi:hypothetical protein
MPQAQKPQIQWQHLKPRPISLWTPPLQIRPPQGEALWPLNESAAQPRHAQEPLGDPQCARQDTPQREIMRAFHRNALFRRCDTASPPVAKNPQAILNRLLCAPKVERVRHRRKRGLPQRTEFNHQVIQMRHTRPRQEARHFSGHRDRHSAQEAALARIDRGQ